MKMLSQVHSKSSGKQHMLYKQAAYLHIIAKSDVKLCRKNSDELSLHHVKQVGYIVSTKKIFSNIYINPQYATTGKTLASRYDII